MTTLHFPDNLDSTMLSAYTDCPQKFFMEYILRLSPSGTSPDLHAGGALAAGFEQTRRSYFGEKLSHSQSVAKGFEAFTRYWGPYIPPEGHQKDFIGCGFAFSEYFNRFPMATDHCQPHFYADGQPAVEFTFGVPTEVAHPITGMPILYSGRLDMLGILSQQNYKLAVVDEKTTKSLGEYWFRKWAMRGQFYGYAHAVQETLNVEVPYALVRGIGLLKTKTDFAETIVPLSDFRIKRWWTATNMKIREIVGRWEVMQQRREKERAFYTPLGITVEELNRKMDRQNHDVWTYAFGEPCENYGGCAFKQSCLREYPHLFYEDYDTRVWNPLAKDPTEGSVNKLDGMDPIALPDGVL